MTFLSNFYQTNFVMDNKIFTCSEQAFMYLKARMLKDERVASQILQLKAYPLEYKKLGRKIANYNRFKFQYESNKDKLMKKAVLAKFSNTTLQTQLLQTGQAELIEISPYDRYWGAGTNNDRDIINHNFQGKNKLGHILMDVRTTYRH